MEVRAMPRGDKGSYTDKQKRQAEHIEEGYEDRGVSKGEAERRAWATVNKSSGGGKKSGSGRGRKTDTSPMKKGGKKGGKASKGGAKKAASKKSSSKKGASKKSSSKKGGSKKGGSKKGASK
jgi:plasmid stabilization system protein ParE